MPKEEPTAMVMSSAVHTTVLEPSTLLEHYCVAPKCDKRTKESKLGLIRKPKENNPNQ